MSIQNPDGTYLFNDSSDCADSYFTDLLVLPQDGTYTVYLSGTSIGQATFTLKSVAVDASAAIAIDDPAVSLTTTTPAQNVQLTFNGSAQQLVSLYVTAPSSWGCYSLSLTNPDGTYIIINNKTVCSCTGRAGSKAAGTLKYQPC